MTKTKQRMANHKTGVKKMEINDMLRKTLLYGNEDKSRKNRERPFLQIDFVVFYSIICCDHRICRRYFKLEDLVQK